MSHKKHQEQASAQEEAKINNQEEATREESKAESEQTAADTETAAKEESAPSFEEQIASLKDSQLRLQADFDNYRKRTLREKMELIDQAGKKVLESILPALDDLERALLSSEKTLEREPENEALKALIEGEKMIVRKFIDILREQGVKEIEALGKEFDSDTQEAVAKFPAGDDKKGLVIDVTRKGYYLHDKVLRFAQVVVGE